MLHHYSVLFLSQLYFNEIIDFVFHFQHLLFLFVVNELAWPPSIELLALSFIARAVRKLFCSTKRLLRFHVLGSLNTGLALEVASVKLRMMLHFTLLALLGRSKSISVPIVVQFKSPS